jgi:hypothetical protein
MSNATDIGDAFALILREWASDEEWQTMREDNRHIAPGCCASHDFCDANVAMDSAFTHVMGRDLTCDDDVQNVPEMAQLQEADHALWGAAWDYARERYLTAPPWTLGEEIEYANGFLAVVAHVQGGLAVLQELPDSRREACGFVVASGDSCEFHFPREERGAFATLAEAVASLNPEGSL